MLRYIIVNKTQAKCSVHKPEDVCGITEKVQSVATNQNQRRNSMTTDIWENAPEWATHYSTVYEMFIGVYDEGIVSYGVLTDPLIKRPQKEWDGTGLPPVGTRCLYGREEGTVVAHVLDRSIVEVIFQYDSKAKGWISDTAGFKPLPTQEQKERESAVKEMVGTFKLSRDNAERLYDAGYRKAKLDKN